MREAGDGCGEDGSVEDGESNGRPGGGEFIRSDEGSPTSGSGGSQHCHRQSSTIRRWSGGSWAGGTGTN